MTHDEQMKRLKALGWACQTRYTNRVDWIGPSNRTLEVPGSWEYSPIPAELLALLELEPVEQAWTPYRYRAMEMGGMEPNPHGKWVTHEDYAAHMAEQSKRIAKQDAKIERLESALKAAGVSTGIVEDIKRGGSSND